MKRFQPRSFPARPQVRFYVFTSFVGGFIRNSSLLMLILCFGFAAAAAAVNTAKSLWQHPDVRSFVAELEADLADAASSAVDLNTQPHPYYKDLAKVQRDENRARRKLAKELRQRKASASSIKAVPQLGGRI
jgi:Skp family chaperone for outer membrane proteins